MKIFKIIITTIFLLGLVAFISSCSSTESSTYTKVDSKNVVYTKSGAQLWGENCVRCHNVPSPAAYNDVDWDTIGMHMTIRANLTTIEAKKIFDFLKSAN